MEMRRRQRFTDTRDHETAQLCLIERVVTTECTRHRARLTHRQRREGPYNGLCRSERVFTTTGTKLANYGDFEL